MSWLQIGMSKSGNFWVYNVLQNLALLAGVPQSSFIQQEPIYSIANNWKMAFPQQPGIDHISVVGDRILSRIGPVYVMPIDDFDEYLKRASHIWMHTPFTNKTREVLNKVAKTIYIVRDPRDILLSYSRYAFTPYRVKYYGAPKEKNESNFIKNNLHDFLARWVEHVVGYFTHLDEYKVCCVFYERLKDDFDHEIQRISDFLEVKLDKSHIDKLNQDLNFERMKESNANHLKKGSYGQWREAMSPQQIRSCERIAGPLLSYLGYPLTAQESFVTHNLNAKEINSTMANKVLRRANYYRRLEVLKKRLLGRHSHA